MSVLYTAIELYVAKRTVRRPVSCRKPLLRFTRELHKCLVKKRRLWRKLRVNKLDTVARLRYRECVNQWRSLIQQQLMQTEEQLVKRNNIGSLYKFVNKRISSRSGIPPIINDDHVTVTDDQAMAGLFNEYFASVGRPDNGYTASCSSSTESCLDSVEINDPMC